MEQISEKDSINGEIVKFYKENYQPSSLEEYVYCLYLITKEKHLPNRWVMIEISIMEPNKTHLSFMKNYRLVLTEKNFVDLLEQRKVSLSKYDSCVLELISK